MSRRAFLALACTLTVSLCGCFHGVPLRPIQGPTPKPEPLMDPRGAFRSGPFYVDLDDVNRPFFHEECSGRWEPPFSPKANEPGADDFAVVWDIAFGVGFYEKNVLTAKQCARGSGTSKKGTKLEAEICEFRAESNGRIKWKRRLVAKDNHNNIYAVPNAW